MYLKMVLEVVDWIQLDQVRVQRVGKIWV